jgi:uncharacterized protein
VRLFLDANILFSAADPASATRILFHAAQKYADLFTNPHAWEEANRNLAVKRLEYSSGLQDLLRHVNVSHSFCDVEVKGLPEFDVPILAGAVASRCSHLWTSDKRHFGKWYGHEVLGIAVVSSILLAGILIEKGWKP